MKKIIAILSVVVLTLMVGCSKEKRCQCTSVSTLDAHNNPVVTFIHVDNGFHCNKITQVGFERLFEGRMVRDMDEVTCEEARE